MNALDVELLQFFAPSGINLLPCGCLITGYYHLYRVWQ